MTGPLRATVVLADDHPFLLRGLQQMLDCHEDFHVVDTCADGASTLEALRQEQPDLAIVDFNMPQGGGMAILSAVLKEGMKTRVVFLTAGMSDQQIVAAVASGLHGLILKETAPEQLLICLKEVAAGRRWLPSDVVQPALGREAERRDLGRRLIGELTAREIEIVRLIADGLSNRGIADRLGVTEGTVKVHLHRIYEKVGVGNRTSLASLALSQQDRLN